MLRQRIEQMIALADEGGDSPFAAATRNSVVSSPVGVYVDADKLHASLQSAGLVVTYETGTRGVKVTVCPPTPPGKSAGWGLLAQATTISARPLDDAGSPMQRMRAELAIKAEALCQAVASRLVEEAKAAGRTVPGGGGTEMKITPGG